MSAPVLSGIDHVVLYVSDVEASLDWYTEYFNLPVERLEAWRSKVSSFVSLRVSPSCIIDLVERAPDGTNVDHVAFVTDRDQFDAFVSSHADLIEMGPAELSGAQGKGLGIYLRDPDGHRLELRTYG